MQHTPEGPRSQDPESPRDASRARRSAAALAALAVFGATGAPSAHALGHTDPPTPDERPDAVDGPARTVQPGDSIWSIATVNGLSVDELMDWNGLSGDAALSPGDTLRLSAPPAEAASEGRHAEGSAAPERDGAADRRSASASDEAARVADPAAAVDPGDVDRGDVDRDHEDRDDEPASSSADHRVAPGDTLWSLSQRHELSVQELIEANDLDVAAPLPVGRTLRIPAAQPAAASPDDSDDRTGADADADGRRAPTDAPAGTEREAPAEREAAAQRPAGVPTVVEVPGEDRDEQTLASAQRHLEQLHERPSPSPEQMQQMVRRTALEMGVDPALAMAHAEQESHFVHRSVSSADAVGTMQVLPSSGEWASELVGRDLDLLDPQDNVTAGVAIIRANQHAAGDREIGIASYYQGAYGVEKYGMYDDTKIYVREVTTRISAWTHVR